MYTDYGSGRMSPESAIGIWAAMNIFIVSALTIRYIVIKSDERYKNQSDLKNFFYSLEDNTKEEYEKYKRNGWDWARYIKSDVHPLTIFLIMVNSFALIGWLAFKIKNLV